MAADFTLLYDFVKRHITEEFNEDLLRLEYFPYGDDTIIWYNDKYIGYTSEVVDEKYFVKAKKRANRH